MENIFNFDKFITLGFCVSTHNDSWDREVTEYTYTRDGIKFTLREKKDSEFAMGIYASDSGERENHIVDEDEALRWFQRTFPDFVL